MRQHAVLTILKPSKAKPSSLKIWATYDFWAAREIWAKPIFKENVRACTFFRREIFFILTLSQRGKAS